MRAYEMTTNNLEVVKDFQHDLPHISGDEHQLQQVFLNIVINAEQAMTESQVQGVLTVGTRGTESAVVVTIKDDGPGIPQENLTRIFDPFFTTKDIGKGSGLGLSICYGIVEEHGGSMKVDSELGKGTTFTIELPKASEP